VGTIAIGWVAISAIVVTISWISICIVEDTCIGFRLSCNSSNKANNGNL